MIVDGRKVCRKSTILALISNGGQISYWAERTPQVSSICKLARQAVSASRACEHGVSCHVAPVARCSCTQHSERREVTRLLAR